MIRLAHGPLVFYGWQAAPVRGGACGGLEFPAGPGGSLGLKLRLRRTRALLQQPPMQLYYKEGVEAPCGALGSRLVPPRLWRPVPVEAVRIRSFISRDGRFLNVQVSWV